MSGEVEIQWRQTDMVEVVLNEPDDFLKVRETLTRIGVASRKERKIYQSCHILHKQGRYFIVHFKELFALDGKNTNLSLNDIDYIVFYEKPFLKFERLIETYVKNSPKGFSSFIKYSL